jgi:hypothetical protein
MMAKQKDDVDKLIEFLYPLVEIGLGKIYSKHIKDVLMDYKYFIEEFELGDKIPKLPAIEERTINFRIIQILCSYYTLNVPLPKEVYWRSCYDRDFEDAKSLKENKKTNEVNEALAKSFEELDDFSSGIILLRDTYKASEGEIAHLLELNFNNVEKEYRSAQKKLFTLIKKNGVEIID